MNWCGRDEAAHGQHSDDKQHNQRKDGDTDPAPRASERLPHFLIKIEVIRLGLPNYGPFAQPPQAESMMFVKIVESLRGDGRGRTRLAEVLDDVPFFAENRDHGSILPYSQPSLA
jgi:hypothetical protein